MDDMSGLDRRAIQPETRRHERLVIVELERGDRRAVSRQQCRDLVAAGATAS